MISKFAQTIKGCYLSKKIVKGWICGSENSFIPSTWISWELLN